MVADTAKVTITD